MLKLFFRKLSQSFCIYLLVTANLIHAMEEGRIDWLVVLSVILGLLSVLLCYFAARKEARNG